MILILGATGLLGNEICRQLRNLGDPVRAMVRASSDPLKKAVLEQMGAQLVIGDLRDPSSFNAALRGVDTVISTVSAMPSSYAPDDNNIEQVDWNGMQNFIDAAKEMEVAHFTYISASSKLNADIPLINAKRKVEKYLEQSEIPYTILCPSCFTEVWLSPAVGFDVLGGTVNVYGDGTQPVSYISYVDVAKFAVESLYNPIAQNRKIQLGGPEAISQLEAVRIFEEIAERKLDVQHVPVEALIQQRKEASDQMEKSFAGLMEYVARGDSIDMAPTLKDFPVSMRSVREVAQSALMANTV